jgi:DNA repair protein RecN (Recombination protein N)
MLTQLTIQNFGLIDHLSLDFDGRLNIFTGETGAGKSILIGALRIALGDRISVDQLRDADQPCRIQAAFDLAKSPLRDDESLEDFISAGDGEVIIHRVFQKDGKQKIRINGLAATVTQLKEIGNLLIDFHGPHDHQRLLSCRHHLSMLDRLTGHPGPNFDDYAALYREYLENSKQHKHLAGMRSSRDRDIDLLSHQVRELEQIKLDEAAYEQSQREKIRIAGAEKLFEHARNLIDWLDGDEHGSSPAIRKAFYPLQRLTQLDESAAPFLDRLSSVQAAHDQLIIDLKDYINGLSFEPAEARRASDTCDAYEDILRKYGPTMAEARAFYEEAKTRLDLLGNLEHNDRELREAIGAIEKSMKTKAAVITKQRRAAAGSLKSTIEKELSELGIKHVRFEARVEPDGFNPDGADRVTFYISPNAGEALKPLADIVSSGEAARVMLALKKALVKADPVPVLIFDEIDAQIGGRLGTVTGQKLKDISFSRQVILITHLPQIASFADRHFKVMKIVKDGRALTTVKILDGPARVDEIAQMMSGTDTTAISLKHATDMLSKAGK